MVFKLAILFGYSFLKWVQSVLKHEVCEDFMLGKAVKATK